eukprot:3482119-Prymnesium_polylepis.1
MGEGLRGEGAARRARAPPDPPPPHALTAPLTCSARAVLTPRRNHAASCARRPCATLDRPTLCRHPLCASHSPLVLLHSPLVLSTALFCAPAQAGSAAMKKGIGSIIIEWDADRPVADQLREALVANAVRAEGPAARHPETAH